MSCADKDGYSEFDGEFEESEDPRIGRAQALDKSLIEILGKIEKGEIKEVKEIIRVMRRTLAVRINGPRG